MVLIRSAPYLILLFAAAAPFWRQLVLGAGLLDDDVFVQNLPAWEWLARTLRSGESPLWSSEMLGGFPLSFTQYPFLYPPTWLLVQILPTAQAVAWSHVLHLFATGVLTYLYCRVLGLSVGPSLLAAISFQMSTEIVAGNSANGAHSFFGLPGTLLGVELVLRGGWRWGPLLSVVTAASLLAGHPQLMLIALATGPAYAAFRLALLARTGGAREALSLAGFLALAWAVGVAGAAIRLLPEWEVALVSTRSAGLPQEATGGGGTLSPQGMVAGYLLPLTRLVTLRWGTADYMGPTALVLALIGVRYLVRQSLGRFFLALALLTALVSLGELTPFHYLTRVPPFSFFRGPQRFNVVTTFALAMLGSMALEEFGGTIKRADRGRTRLLLAATVLACSVSGVLLLLGAFFQFGTGPTAEGFRAWSLSLSIDSLNPLRPRMVLAVVAFPMVPLALSLASAEKLSRRYLEASLVGLTLAVLVPLAFILDPGIDPRVVQRVPETVRFLEKQDGLYRVFSYIPGIMLYNHTRDFGPEPEEGFADDLRYRFQAEMLSPILNLRWGVSSVDGYENLHSRYQEVLLRYTMSQSVSGWVQMDPRWGRLSLPERLRVLSMLNARYVLSAMDLSEHLPGLRPVAKWSVDPGPLSRAAPSVFLMENPGYLPRYYLVPAARAVEGTSLNDDADAAYAIASGAVDPSSVVLIHGVRDVPTRAEGSAPVDPASWKRGVEPVSLHNVEVVLSVSCDRPAYLVTSDSYWPGWRAWVDGREAPVYRANVGGRAVWLGEAGTHTVTFRFDPPGFATGLAISLSALLAWALWLGAGAVTGRRRPRPLRTP